MERASYSEHRWLSYAVVVGNHSECRCTGTVNNCRARIPFCGPSHKHWLQVKARLERECFRRAQYCPLPAPLTPQHVYTITSSHHNMFIEWLATPSLWWTAAGRHQLPVKLNFHSQAGTATGPPGCLIRLQRVTRVVSCVLGYQPRPGPFKSRDHNLGDRSAQTQITRPGA